MFFSMLALILVRRYAGEGNVLSKNAVLTSLLVLTSYFTRGIGLALVAATVLYLLLEGKLNLRKAAFIGLTFLIPAALWTIRNHTISPERQLPSILRESLGYGRELILVNPSDPYSKTIGFGDLIVRLRRNITYYEGLISNIVSGKSFGAGLGAHLISAVVLIGLIYCFIRQRTIVEYYFPFYMLIYLAWPSWQGERFLVPVIPFIFYYVLRTTELLLSLVELIFRLIKRKVSIEGKGFRLIEGAVLLALVLFLVRSNWAIDVNIVKRERARPYYDKVISDFLDVIGWIKENTPPETVVISDRPSWVYLLSGRKTFSFPWVPNTDEVVGFIRQIKADYVIVNPISSVTSRYLVPSIERNQEKFKEVYRRGNSIAYRVYMD
jgi:hypothetical protein